MKKLRLDSLRVDSFVPSPAGAALRGTVAARENTGTGACPDSWDGTCYITCWDSCACPTWDC